MRKLGELGISGPEARSRLERLLKLGLDAMYLDPMTPFTSRQREFIRDMKEALSENPIFEPSFGQVSYAQDLYDRYCL